MLETSLAPRNKTPAADFSLAIINVIFLLLFFFILTGSVVQRKEMVIAPPFTKNLPLERLPRPLIAISAENTLFLDGIEISLKELLSGLGNKEDNKDIVFSELNILAEGTLAAKAFLKTVDALRKSGLPIRIVTIRVKPEKTSGS